jgi:hypothetical protein
LGNISLESAKCTKADVDQSLPIFTNFTSNTP